MLFNNFDVSILYCVENATRNVVGVCSVDVGGGQGVKNSVYYHGVGSYFHYQSWECVIPNLCNFCHEIHIKTNYQRLSLHIREVNIHFNFFWLRRTSQKRQRLARIQRWAKRIDRLNEVNKSIVSLWILANLITLFNLNLNIFRVSKEFRS